MSFARPVRLRPCGGPRHLAPPGLLLARMSVPSAGDRDLPSFVFHFPEPHIASACKR